MRIRETRLDFLRTLLSEATDRSSRPVDDPPVASSPLEGWTAFGPNARAPQRWPSKVFRSGPDFKRRSRKIGSLAVAAAVRVVGLVIIDVALRAPAAQIRNRPCWGVVVGVGMVSLSREFDCTRGLSCSAPSHSGGRRLRMRGPRAITPSDSRGPSRRPKFPVDWRQSVHSTPSRSFGRVGHPCPRNRSDAGATEQQLDCSSARPRCGRARSADRGAAAEPELAP